MGHEYNPVSLVFTAWIAGGEYASSRRAQAEHCTCMAYIACASLACFGMSSEEDGKWREGARGKELAARKVV